MRSCDLAADDVSEALIEGSRSRKRQCEFLAPNIKEHEFTFSSVRILFPLWSLDHSH